MSTEIEINGRILTVYDDGLIEWNTTYKTGHRRKWRTYGYNSTNGYKQVRVKDKVFLVHRIVAQAFIPNPENKPQVDHIIPVSMGGTNDASNLRWCTNKENHNNPISIENHRKANRRQKVPCVRSRTHRCANIKKSSRLAVLLTIFNALSLAINKLFRTFAPQFGKTSTISK